MQYKGQNPAQLNSFLHRIPFAAWFGALEPCSLSWKVILFFSMMYTVKVQPFLSSKLRYGATERPLTIKFFIFKKGTAALAFITDLNTCQLLTMFIERGAIHKNQSMSHLFSAFSLGYTYSVIWIKSWEVFLISLVFSFTTEVRMNHRSGTFQY